MIDWLDDYFDASDRELILSRAQAFTKAYVTLSRRRDPDVQDKVVRLFADVVWPLGTEMGEDFFRNADVTKLRGGLWGRGSRLRREFARDVAKLRSKFAKIRSGPFKERVIFEGRTHAVTDEFLVDFAYTHAAGGPAEFQRLDTALEKLERVANVVASMRRPEGRTEEALPGLESAVRSVFVFFQSHRDILVKVSVESLAIGVIAGGNALPGLDPKVPKKRIREILSALKREQLD